MARGYQVTASRALGRPVKAPMIVHHHTDDQLVICENQTYHKLLHTRQDVLRAGGNPNTQRLCRRCGPAPIESFRKKKGQVESYCRPCESALERARQARRKAEAAQQQEMVGF
jgi:hypothetical protein